MSHESSAEERTSARVYVSYADGDAEDMKAVLAFARLLFANGVYAVLDVWAAHERRDWPAWRTTEIRAADFVVVVASSGYGAAGDGTASGGLHRNAQAE